MSEDPGPVPDEPLVRRRFGRPEPALDEDGAIDEVEVEVGADIDDPSRAAPRSTAVPPLLVF